MSDNAYSQQLISNSLGLAFESRGSPPESQGCLLLVKRDEAVFFLTCEQGTAAQAGAAEAVLRLTERQRCSRMTIVTPYTHTMTAGMTTNR